MKPIDRFGLDLGRIRFLPPSDVNDELFFVEQERTVLADNTFIHPRSARQALVLQAKAHGLRSTATVSERRLWAELSGKKLGTAFRRQTVLCGKYVVDLYAPAARLVIEVDGIFHSRTRSADARRDAALARAGYRILRLEVEFVMHQLPEALERIRAALVQAR